MELDKDKTLLIIKPSLYQFHVDRIAVIDIVREKLTIEDSIFYLDGEVPHEQIQNLYEPHQKEWYYESFINFMMMGKIMVYKISGENAVIKVNRLKGATNPKEAFSHTIRGRFKQFSFAIYDNFIHTPSTVEEAKRELDIFFT